MSPGSTVVSTLELEQLAKVEVTSEDPNFPIESALVSGTGPGWRAAEPRTRALSSDSPVSTETDGLDGGAK
jgi:hypothetical protein